MEVKRESIISAGAIMLVYAFIVIIAYFCISPFMDAFFTNLLAADAGEATDELASLIPDYQWFFNMFFALLAAVPITWFIAWVMSREPDWSYRGRF